MKLSQLKYFVSICNNGGVTAAAQSLHVSQPSLSVAIKELERELDVDLFFHRNRRLILTDEGKFFFQKASEILEKVNALETHMKNVSMDSKKIRIGVPTMAAVFLYPKIIMSFNELYPSIRVEMVETGTNELEHLFNTAQLDAAITNHLSFTNLYQTIPMMEAELMGCVSKTHHLAGKTDVTIPMLKNEKFILMSPGSLTSMLVHQAFKNEKTELDQLMYSHQLYLIFNVIQKRGMVSFLVDELLKNNEEVATFSLANPIRFTYYLIRRLDIHPGKDMVNFIKHCEKFKLQPSSI